MSKGQKAWKTFFFWLLPGSIAGILLAAFLSVQQFQVMEKLAGNVLQENSLERGLKQAMGSNTRQVKEQGQAFLSEYGYRVLSSFGTYLPFTASVSILFFQVLGWIQYGFWLKEENTRTKRIQSLTRYLKAVNAGQGGSLTRKEDAFSFL